MDASIAGQRSSRQASLHVRTTARGKEQVAESEEHLPIHAALDCRTGERSAISRHLQIQVSHRLILLPAIREASA
jgi:hypothetical protein